MTGWYLIKHADGATIARVFAQTPDDLEANTPPNCTAEPEGPSA